MWWHTARSLGVVFLVDGWTAPEWWCDDYRWTDEPRLGVIHGWWMDFSYLNIRRKVWGNDWFHWLFVGTCKTSNERLASKFFVFLTALGSGSHREKVMFVLWDHTSMMYNSIWLNTYSPLIYSIKLLYIKLYTNKKKHPRKLPEPPFDTKSRCRRFGLTFFLSKLRAIFSPGEIIIVDTASGKSMDFKDWVLVLVKCAKFDVSVSILVLRSRKYDIFWKFVINRRT